MRARNGGGIPIVSIQNTVVPTAQPARTHLSPVGDHSRPRQYTGRRSLATETVQIAQLSDTVRPTERTGHRSRPRHVRTGTESNANTPFAMSSRLEPPEVSSQMVGISENEKVY